MRLIDHCHRERRTYSLVCALYHIDIAVVIGALVLIDEYSRIRQRLKAVAIEFLCKKPLTRPEWVGRVNYDKVIFALLSADEF